MKRPRKPLDSTRLEELALHYVGRFATTRAKLARYLNRKVYERGWEGEGDAPVAALVEKFASAGYVDDAAFASMKGRDLTARGYGSRRVGQALYAAGVSDDDAAGAQEAARKERIASALKFARRRRLGPYASEKIEDPRQRQRAIAAFARAGHGFDLAQKIIDLPPGDDIDPADLED